MNGLEYEREKKKERTVDISTMNLSNKALKALLVASTVYQYQKKTKTLQLC